MFKEAGDRPGPIEVPEHVEKPMMSELTTPPAPVPEVDLADPHWRETATAEASPTEGLWSGATPAAPGLDPTTVPELPTKPTWSGESDHRPEAGPMYPDLFQQAVAGNALANVVTVHYADGEPRPGLDVPAYSGRLPTGSWCRPPRPARRPRSAPSRGPRPRSAGDCTAEPGHRPPSAGPAGGTIVPPRHLVEGLRLTPSGRGPTADPAPIRSVGVLGIDRRGTAARPGRSGGIQSAAGSRTSDRHSPRRSVTCSGVSRSVVSGTQPAIVRCTW